MKRSTRNAYLDQYRSAYDVHYNGASRVRATSGAADVAVSLAQAAAAEPLIPQLGGVLLGTALKVSAAAIKDLVPENHKTPDVADALDLGGTAIWAAVGLSEAGQIATDVIQAFRGIVPGATQPPPKPPVFFNLGRGPQTDVAGGYQAPSGPTFPATAP